MGAVISIISQTMPVSRPAIFFLLLFVGLPQSTWGNPTIQERFEPENPSPFFSPSGQKDEALLRQVGRAVITDAEMNAKRAENERVAKRDARQREKENLKQARLAARKSSSEIPERFIGYQGTTHYTIKRGDTLGKIAADLYGNPAYATLISIYNQKPASRLYPGEVIKTPSPHDVLMTVGRPVYQRYPYAVRDILRVHEQFKALEPALRSEKEAGSYSEGTKKQLDELIWLMEQIKSDLMQKVEGVTDYPNSTTTQLHSAYNNLKAIRKGDLGRRNLRLQRVHLYLINGFSYAVAWGREGFQAKKPSQ